jgi:hypothetical protein
MLYVHYTKVFISKIKSSVMHQFLYTLRDKLFKIFSIVYPKVPIGYHEHSTNLVNLKLHLHFIKFKNISKAHGFPFFANKIFKISSNFMGRVLKRTQLHEYFFLKLYSTILRSCSSNLIYTKKII